MGKHLFDTRAVTQIKISCQDLGFQKFCLSEKEWVEISEMVENFKNPHIVAVVLRKRDLTSSEFLLNWKQAVFKLDKMVKPLATLLIQFSASSSKTFADEQSFCDDSVGMFSFILFVCNDTVFSKTYVIF